MPTLRITDYTQVYMLADLADKYVESDDSSGHKNGDDFIEYIIRMRKESIILILINDDKTPSGFAIVTNGKLKGTSTLYVHELYSSDVNLSGEYIMSLIKELARRLDCKTIQGYTGRNGDAMARALGNGCYVKGYVLEIEV